MGEAIREANTSTGMLWSAGGPRRPKLEDIAVRAFREFSVATYATPELAAPGGEMSQLWPYAGVQASDYNVFFHSDHAEDLLQHSLSTASELVAVGEPPH